MPEGFTLIPCTDLHVGDRVRVFYRGEYVVTTITSEGRKISSRDRPLILYRGIYEDVEGDVLFDVRNSACCQRSKDTPQMPDPYRPTPEKDQRTWVWIPPNTHVGGAYGAWAFEMRTNSGIPYGCFIASQGWGLVYLKGMSLKDLQENGWHPPPNKTG